MYYFSSSTNFPKLRGGRSIKGVYKILNHWLFIFFQFNSGKIDYRIYLLSEFETKFYFESSCSLVTSPGIDLCLV